MMNASAPINTVEDLRMIFSGHVAERLTWTAEEFEDHVARALIALYETDVLPTSKRVGHAQVNAEDWRLLRARGPFFSHPSSVANAWSVPVSLVGAPRSEFVSIATDPAEPGEDSFRGYLATFWAQRRPYLPAGVRRTAPGQAYRCVSWIFGDRSAGVVASAEWVTIDPAGRIHLCVERGGRDHRWLNQLDFLPTKVSIALTWSADRARFWNVTAREKDAAATFAVEEEQIASLFYARTAPMTARGRKRPILHWVATHRRRIKEGISVDVREHLRGISEFDFCGTRFHITQPRKVSATR